MPHEKIPFRAAYFVYVKEKLIFFHEKDTCNIVAVWDCRNNPKLLQDKLGEE